MKELALAHIEKIVLGLCVLVMLSFLYSALSMKSYDKDPELFTKKAREARDNVDKAKASLDDLTPPELDKTVASLRAGVDTKPFEFGNRWLRPFDFGLSFRNQPNILKPGAPEVLLNRGLMKLYRTDVNGKRIVREVKAGAARYPLSSVENQRPVLTEADIASLREKGFEPDEAAFIGNESIFDEIGGQIEEAPADAPEEADAAAPVRVNEVKRRREQANVKPKTEKKEKAAVKDEAKVKELVLGMVGKEWVEVVAPFPHAEQIKEFVKALREPADMVGLRYARAEVQRRQFLGDPEWSEWESVPVKEQWAVIQNAVSWELEPFPDVALRGLCMHIPSLVTVDNEFLLPEALKKPHAAEYTEAELNPLAKEKPKPKRKPRPGDAKDKPAAAPLKPKLLRIEGGVPPVPRGGEVAFQNRYQLGTGMIRYWDFTVVPGRRYQYRVRVAVYNPNFDRSDVADREYANNKYLIGPWSDPSPEVYIEPNVLWFIAEKQTSNRAARANIEVQFWSRDVGEWIVNGDFAHTVGDVIGVRAIHTPSKVERWEESQGKFVAQEIKFDKGFDTGAIVADILGGQVREVPPGGGAPKSFKLPREVVAVNAFGDLTRRNEDEDKENEIRRANRQRYEAMSSAAGGTPSRNADPEPADDADSLDPIKNKKSK